MVALLLIAVTAYIAFGGIRKVTKVTDKVVPVMAVVYVAVVFVLILLNLHSVPYFLGAVFGGAFTPQAIFGGVFGTVLVQGVKRGLMSNEAGQGTITMAAGAANTCLLYTSWIRTTSSTTGYYLMPLASIMPKKEAPIQETAFPLWLQPAF